MTVMISIYWLAGITCGLFAAGYFVARQRYKYIGEGRYRFTTQSPGIYTIHFDHENPEEVPLVMRNKRKGKACT